MKSWNRTDDPKVGPLVLFLGFVFVHFAFAMLTWVAHAAPSVFEYRIIPFVEGSSRAGLLSSLCSLIPWACLTRQQWKYAKRLLPVS